VTSYSDEDRAGLSATTFLTLCVAWGPHAAFFLTVTAMLIGMWVLICKRFPFLGHLTVVFIDGFVSGLFDYRSRYYYRSRTRRWR
jgi:hypothetical protein